MPTSLDNDNERTIIEGLHAYFVIWLQYKWFVFLSTFFVTAIVVALCAVSLKLPPSESFLPNFYTSHGKLLIQQRTQDDISSTILSNLGIPETTTPRGFDYGAQIMALARSRTILDPIIEEFGFEEEYYDEEMDTIRTLVLERFQFQYTASTAMMDIYFTDIDPVRAKDIVNRMIVLLDEWYISRNNQAKNNQRIMLEKTLAEVKTDIERLGVLMKRIPDIDPRYPQYAAELDIQQRIYTSLFPQYEATRLVPESQPVFQVFEIAETPVEKSGPARTQYVLMALFGAFGGSSAIAFALNLLKSFKRKQLVS